MRIQKTRSELLELYSRSSSLICRAYAFGLDSLSEDERLEVLCSWGFNREYYDKLWMPKANEPWRQH